MSRSLVHLTILKQNLSYLEHQLVKTLDGLDIIEISSPATKIWYLDDSKTGHLGVGPSLEFDIEIYGSPREYYYPSFYAAPPGTFCGGAWRVFM